MVRANYSFGGWNTASDGSGVAETGGTSLTLTANVVLYAQWIPDTFVVTFDPGQGAASPGTTNFTVGGPAIQLPSASRADYLFAGWFSAPSGGLLLGNAGDTFTPTQSETLYAQWAPIVYVVSLNSGIGSATMTSVNYVDGSTGVTLPTPTNGSDVFEGWFSAPTGGSLLGVGGATFVPTSSMTLYAQWGAPLSVAVVFNLNGGAGALNALSVTPDSTVTLPAASAVVNVGHVLTGWSTSATGGASTYTPGQTVTVTAGTTFYAQWAAVATSTLWGTFTNVLSPSNGISVGAQRLAAKLVADVRVNNDSVISLYGYVHAPVNKSLALSLMQARVVATCLRKALAKSGLRSVRVTFAGERVNAPSTGVEAYVR